MVIKVLLKLLKQKISYLSPMILVTGATGLVGSHLVYRLASQGETVRALYRTPSKLNTVKDVFKYYTPNYQSIFDTIEWVQTDITNIPQLIQAFKDIDYVYHVAAYISFNPKRYAVLKKVNVEGTANVVNIALINGIKKLCYVSSIATLGSTSGDALITEKTEYNPEVNNSVYAMTKYAAEMEVWRGTQEGLPAVIVHPGVILGVGHYSSASGSIIKSVYKGINRFTSGGVGVVDVNDVVAIMIRLMKSDIINDHFILVGTNYLYKDLLTDLANALGKKPPSKAVSKKMLLFLSKLDWLSNVLFSTKRKLFKTTVHSLFEKEFYDASKVKKLLNITFTPPEDTITTVCSHFLQSKSEHNSTKD